jgi:AcrR family transcriptional regulator
MPLASGEGHRQNIRGRRSREQLLDTAFYCIATGGPEAVSANLIAREAGVSWGRVNYQFGGTDGFWAALMEYLEDKLGPFHPEIPDHPGIAERVGAIIVHLWKAIDLPANRAVSNLRLGLPRKVDQLESAYPQTAAALASWDRRWNIDFTRAFDGLPVKQDKVRKVVAMLPGAMSGLRAEHSMVGYIDVEQARQGLAEVIIAYLST